MFLSAKRKDKSGQPLEHSRRRFFKQLSSIVVGSAVLSSTAAIGGQRAAGEKFFTGEGSMVKSNTNEFSPHLGDQFEISSADGQSLKVKLIEVTDRSPCINKDDGAVRQECFSLLFQGSLDQPLTQSTYSFKHSQMGTFDLFIVPVGKDKTAMQYEAVINRLLS